jgi:L-ascorbate metabolism protein UlaG (beta-lactamase superfamily)
LRVTYIGHSGFLLETEDAYFIFDYFEGEVPKMKKEKALVVFSSHRHHDHFNPQILEWVKANPQISYVLSKDILIKHHIRKYKEQGISLEKNIHIIKKNTTESLELSNGKTLKITTFHSTDEGVAFLLEYEGKRFYHAGDLNCWDWEEKPKSYRKNMVKEYTNEIQKMQGMKIDVAFVPLDPRLEGTAFEGMEIFLEHTDSKVVFPMHFWGKYEIIRDFLEKHPEYSEKIRTILAEGQNFEI